MTPSLERQGVTLTPVFTLHLLGCLVHQLAHLFTDDGFVGVSTGRNKVSKNLVQHILVARRRKSCFKDLYDIIFYVSALNQRGGPLPQKPIPASRHFERPFTAENVTVLKCPSSLIQRRHTILPSWIA